MYIFAFFQGKKERKLSLTLVIGVVCCYALPEVLSASSLSMAVVMGGASGLAATGGE